MLQKRKGSRLIHVNGVAYSWFRGKTFIEIRNLETNKAKRVLNETLEKHVAVPAICDCCHEYVYVDGKLITYPKLSMTPSDVREFIVTEQF